MVARDAHLVVVHHERVPSNILDQFCSDIEADSLELRREIQPPKGFHAGLETLLLPAVALLLLKPYFDGFLQEAGKDHYVALKKALKTIWFHFFGKSDPVRMLRVTADGVKEAEHSLTFAIYAEIDDGRRVKLLFPAECSEDEYDAAIGAFLELLAVYHLSARGTPARSSLDEEKDYWNHILVEFDRNTGSLRILDPIAHSKERARAKSTDK